MIRTIEYKVILFEELDCFGWCKADIVSIVINRGIYAESISDWSKGANVDNNSRFQSLYSFLDFGITHALFTIQYLPMNIRQGYSIIVD